MSCSYGPGRYDPSYEENGIDYPIGYVRWTEKRNFEAVLHCLRKKQLNVDKLISEKYDIKDAKSAYESLLNKKHIYAILISYQKEIELNSKNINLIKNQKIEPKKQKVSVGVIGAGNYSSRIILPLLSKTIESFFFLF